MKFFESAQEKNLSEQRQLEEKIESDLKNFRSLIKSKVVVPLGSIKEEDSLWGRSEPRVLPVEVILGLKKRNRLTKNEYRGILNIVTSSLSERDRLVQVVVRDEEGHEWNEDDKLTQELFVLSSSEQEIENRLKTRWADKIQWKDISLADSTGTCRLTGAFNGSSALSPSSIRRDVMSVVQDLCKFVQISLAPSVSNENVSNFSSEAMLWLERVSFFLLGLSVWGLLNSFWALRDKKKLVTPQMKSEDDDAIILTRIVERSPDEAAKWMVQAMLSEPETFDQKENDKEAQL